MVRWVVRLRWIEDGGVGGAFGGALVTHPTSYTSRQKRKEAAIWQRRFWEHTIESEEDLEVHLDYFISIRSSTDWSSVPSIGRIRVSQGM